MLLCAADIPGEGYTFDIDQVKIAANDDGENMAFIGHVQNFHVDGVDVIALLQRHASAAGINSRPVGDDSVPAHSVRTNTGELTYREIPIPVHPVTLRAGPADMDYLGLATLDLSYGNATLKLMFKTLVSCSGVAWVIGARGGLQFCRPQKS